MFKHDREGGRGHFATTLYAAFFVALATFAAAGEDEEPNRQAAADRSRLRYDGRSFEEWRREFVTELNPERRMKALPVLTRFGRHGYAAEAARTIVEALGDADDGALFRATVSHLQELGAAAVPALVAKLKTGSDELRVSVAKTLATLGPTAVAAAPVLLEVAAAALDALPPGSQVALGAAAFHDIPRLAGKALPELALAGAAFDALDDILEVATPELRNGLDSRSPGMRCVCAQLIPRLAGNVPKNELPIASLLALLEDASPLVRSSAAVALWQLAADSPQVIAALKEAIGKDGPIAYDLVASLYATQEGWLNEDRYFVWQPKLSRHAEQFSAAAVDLLVALVESPDFSKPASARRIPRRDVLNLLAMFGPRAAPAVGGLIRLLKTSEPWMRCAAIDVLGAIGPGAALAAVVLQELTADDTGADDAPILGGAPVALEAGRRPAALYFVMHPEAVNRVVDLPTVGAHARAALSKIRLESSGDEAGALQPQ